MTATDITNLVMGTVGLVASILAYRQSERAAESAAQAERRSDEASRNSLLAAERADNAIDAARHEAQSRTFGSHLLLALQLIGEVETLLSHSVFSGVQIRSRDLAKQLTYMIAKFDKVISPATLTALVEARAQMEQIALKLRHVQTLAKPEHSRLTGIVHRVAETMMTEHARTEG